MITTQDKILGQKLKKFRIQNKIKQTAMADLLNLESQQQISDLENGKKQFTDELILKVCEVFRISITELLDEALPKNVQTYYLSQEELEELEQAADSETKMVCYKKLFLKTKIESVENRLKSLVQPSKTEVVENTEFMLWFSLSYRLALIF